MSLLTNLVSYYKLDESSGNASDAVGSNTGTNTGSLTFGTGKINNGAIYPNSTGHYFDCGSNVSLQLSTFTYTAWVNTDFTHGSLFNRTAGSGPSFNIKNTGKLGFDKQGTVSLALSTGTISASTWTHIALTYDNSTGNYAFYINGSNAGSGTITTQSFSFSSNFIMGDNGSAYYYGTLDEVGVWSRALTSGEITTLYNGGAGLQYPFTINNSGFFNFM